MLLALLPQLLLAGLAPALVICQEGSGARAVELSLSACCADAPALEEHSGYSLGADEDGCGDCQDDTLSVSLQRGAAPYSLCAHLLAPRLVWELPLQRWSAPSCSRAPPELAPPSPALGELSTLRLRC
ncbi:MAG TPA: hypothetical protein DEA08_22830 [Planctomycetes bacterium]|nr:hypothetical protein [Planctomycetota bacterium]